MTSFKNRKLSAELTVPMRFAIFRLQLSKLLRLPQKSEDLMLQNAALLRKSAPGPPNSSDEHVSCTALATENASV